MNDMTKLKKKLKGTPKPIADEPKLLSTGSTLLNLACSGKRSGGFPEGTYVFLVGDSASGKTFLSLTCFAEAVRSAHFKDHRLIFDCPEGGAMMDLAKFFGQAVADKIEMRESQTIEEFYDALDDDCSDGRPFIAVLDSMDSLTSEAEGEKFQEQKTARSRGTSGAGSFGDGKAKKNSAGLRRLLSDLRRTGSILIIISQTRDNIGFGAQFNPKTRSGGRALRFYATLELWSSIRARLKRTVKGQQRQVGIVCQIEVKKNRLTGRERTVEIPLYTSVGIDDVGSCVSYLIKEKHWSEAKGVVTAPEFSYKGQAEKLIRQIEEGGHEAALRKLVWQVWSEIEAGCEVTRKRRY